MFSILLIPNLNFHGGKGGGRIIFGSDQAPLTMALEKDPEE